MKKLLTLSLFFASAVTFAQKVNLSLDLKLDSTYYLATNGNVTIVEDLPGQKQVITSIISARVAHKVTAIRDSVYEMDVQYKKISFSIELADKTIGFSSDDSLSSNPASKLMAAMVNKGFGMLITKSGRVLEIKNIENIYAGMEAALPNLSEEKKAQLKAQMKQSFGEKSIKTNFQEAFEVFPYRAIGVADQWQNHSSMESIIAYNLVTTFALKEITSDALIIHGSGVMTPNGNGEYKLISGMQMRLNHVEGTGAVDIKLDRASCWIMEAKTTRDVKAIADVKDSPQTPGGITFPISVSSDVTVTGK